MLPVSTAWAESLPVIRNRQLLVDGKPCLAIGGELHRATLKPELDAVWARQKRRSADTWAEVFGGDWQADEIFMACHFDRYMEALAAAGKQALALPMYVNGWLGPQEGQPTAGLYPGGGPARRVLDIWQAAAPSLDLLAPDIYVPDAKAVLAAYDHAAIRCSCRRLSSRPATCSGRWGSMARSAIRFSVSKMDGSTGSWPKSTLC